MKWLKEKSLRCNILNPNHTLFTTVHTIVTKDWVEAWRWEKDSSNQVRLVGEIFVCVRENKEHLTDLKVESLVTAFTELNFVLFDNYASVSNNVCVLRPDLTRQEMFNCTCKQNVKEFTCIHAIGIAMKRAILIPHPEAKVTLLGRKMKRGRRSLAAPAWEHQPFRLNLPVQHPRQDPAILAGLAVNDVHQGIALELL